MDEAKEELEAALLQAKQHCVDIQQKVWDHEKQGLHPHEDLYVRRYIYGVTIARKSRFFNGKSTPPLLQKRERSEPKVKIWDSSDGLSTKVEFTETVDESSVRDMIDNDKQECDELGRKLPVDKRNWEHVEDIRMQAKHLYGFDGIRDLSFQAAADVDRFFGRDPSPDLMFASPYHLLKDYLEEYENRFFKNSLSRSAHDLSEWRKRSSETPAAVVGSSISVGDHLEQAPDVQSQTGYNAYRTETNVQNESHSHSSVLQKAIGTVREWRNALEDSVSQRISDRTSRHGSEPAINHSHHTSYSFDYGTPKFQTTAPFECHHHLVRDLEDSASETALLCDVDVQPIAPGLQSEGSIRSMTSSKASTTAGSLPGDHDFSEGIQTPISTYSDAFEHDDATSERSGHFAGDHRGTHLVRHIGDHLIDKVHSTLNVGGHVKSGNETMTITKTMMMGSEENAPRDEDYSDSETLRVQSSVDPVGVLRPTAELEESHLSLHVSSVPCQSVWEQKIGSKAEEAESLLRDVHRTHNALQEQIDLYDAVVQRPLAVTPPSYDATVPAIPAYSSPITDVLHYAEGELGTQQRLYQDDENIYEEIGAPQTPRIGEGAMGITEVSQLHYADTNLNDLNANIDKNHSTIESRIFRKKNDSQNFSSEKRICPTETFENAKPIPSPTFQKLQHQYTPEDVPHGKAPSPVPPPNSEPTKSLSLFGMILSLVFVYLTVSYLLLSVLCAAEKTTGLRSPTAARRSASSERQEIVHSHQYNERSFGKRESQQPHRGIEKSTAIFDEYTFEGLPTTMEFPVTKGKFVRETSPTPKTRHSIGTGAVATTATSIGKGVEKPTPVIGTGAAVGGSVTVVGSGVDLLKRSPELEDIKPMAPTKPAPIGGGVTSTTTTVGSTVGSESTPQYCLEHYNQYITESCALILS
ncbi:unnamed protein product [Nippostrongylus brasiliensis]|uniref:PH domain-containing protein n=1 Tax=Nippostrongylus brasiliensis TaxID=27835 RepID=A0A158QZA8_NIPBR|nr:unnamed protein product [Nippostrongylus brasiliensis]